ncbi:unnamed protein product [Pleuronectes platessa]|uniref:Uncharacterized protein n=1 Tax=Pleuronectes platessa TaxID=8262 RepID=A0A9N7YI40_PLEPL|nr:unnamed protein product [Pleuronectes platessa]
MHRSPNLANVFQCKPLVGYELSIGVGGGTAYGRARQFHGPRGSSTARCSLVFMTLRWWAPLIFMAADSNPQSDDYAVSAIPACVVIPVVESVTVGLVREADNGSSGASVVSGFCAADSKATQLTATDTEVTSQESGRPPGSSCDVLIRCSAGNELVSQSSVSWLVSGFRGRLKATGNMEYIPD